MEAAVQSLECVPVQQGGPADHVNKVCIKLSIQLLITQVYL